MILWGFLEEESSEPWSSRGQHFNSDHSATVLLHLNDRGINVTEARGLSPPRSSFSNEFLVLESPFTETWQGYWLERFHAYLPKFLWFSLLCPTADLPNAEMRISKFRPGWGQVSGFPVPAFFLSQGPVPSCEVPLWMIFALFNLRLVSLLWLTKHLTLFFCAIQLKKLQMSWSSRRSPGLFTSGFPEWCPMLCWDCTRDYFQWVLFWN